MKTAVAAIVLLVLGHIPSSGNGAYNGKWESIHPLPFFQNEKGVLYLTSEKIRMDIIRDSVYIRERYSTDFTTEDSCTKWPQDFFYKGRITIRNHYLEISGTATDSTFQRTVNKCRGNTELSVVSTFAESGDTLFFNFPRFEYNWSPYPIALVRAGKGKNPKRK
jgi:hypothetical protein